MAKGNSGIGGSAGGGKQTPTNARDIENMNEAQLNQEIQNAKAAISRAEKVMGENDIANTAEARAMREAFPGGVGGDGWSKERIKARNKGLERDAVKAKRFTDAYSQKEAVETRLKNLENAKKQVAGTGKTVQEIKAEAVKKVVSSTPNTLKWKTTQKGGWNNGGYKPKIISAGKFEIHGSDGLYTIFENGKQIGRTDKLSKAKAFVEKRK